MKECIASFIAVLFLALPIVIEMTASHGLHASELDRQENSSLLTEGATTRLPRRIDTGTL